MKTIKWLVSLVPKESRALFACLLIAIMSLTTVVVRQDHRLDEKEVFYERSIKDQSIACNQQIDSLYKVISIVREDSKREVLNSLERIISEQKKIIEDQKRQSNKETPKDNKTLIHGSYKANTKLKSQ